MSTLATTTQATSSRITGSRIVVYLVKAAVLLGLIYLISKFASSMPPICVALLWAGMSAFLALGFAYDYVMRKTHKQSMFKEGGLRARFNSGRVISLLVSFVLAAFLIASLALEVPKWGIAEWCVAILAVPIYLLVSILVGKRIGKEYERPYQAWRSVFWSAGITAVLLCIAFAVLYFVRPQPTFVNAAEAFQYAMHPFQDAQSAILHEAGILVSLTDAFTTYATSKVGESMHVGYTVIQLVLHASSLFGIATLLGICGIDWRELRKVFLPLQTGEEADESSRVRPRYVAVAVALPLLLVAGFMFADAKAAEALRSDDYTAAERFVRKQISYGVYLIDGKYYDKEAVDKLFKEAEQEERQLSDTAQEELVTLVNNLYDGMIENADTYLDWYYSLPADYERLVWMISDAIAQTTGGSETDRATTFVTENFQKCIEENVNTAELQAKIDAFAQASADLKEKYEDELSQYELDVGTEIPEFLVTVEDKKTLDELEVELVEPTQKLMDASARLGLSASAGIAGGVLAKRLTEKLMNKAVGKTIASNIAKVFGPIGIAIGVGIDAAWLKGEELLNRESYKQEIVDAINEQRTETLKALGYA